MGKITIGLLALIVTVASLVAASVIVQYYHPESATVVTISLAQYLDGSLIANETSLDWGEVEAGKSYDWSYTVKNVGSVDCMVYRVVYNLPQGWGYAWDGNETLLSPSQQVDGNLTLTIPLSAADGTYNWYSYLRGE